MHILIGNCTGKYLSLQTRWYQCNPLGTDSVYVLDIQLIPQICGGLFFFLVLPVVEFFYLNQDKRPI